ncbi:MAG: hypothetical protein ABH840_03615, partial [Nanoarchaeota archaeon]
FMLNKMKKIKIMLIIAVIWLVAVLFILYYQIRNCPLVCGPPSHYCNYTCFFGKLGWGYSFAFFGIPSWVIFIYLIFDKLKNRNRPMNRI